MNPLARIFGPNWRTTLSGVGAAFFGLLSILAVAPYQLGELATFIPPEWKARVLVVSAVSAFILRLWNANVAKDARDTPAAPPTSPAVSVSTDAAATRAAIAENPEAAQAIADAVEKRGGAPSA